MLGNWLKTTLLMAAIVALFGVVGAVIGGGQGMLVALALGAAMNFFAYWFSDKIVLRMYNAREVDARSAPDLVNLVAELARNGQLPMPRVFVMHEDQPNAFATGRNPQNAAVAVTTGLLDHLSREEVAGVVAHELAHIANRDTLIMTITATIAGAISMLAQFGMFFGGGNRENNGGFGIVTTLLMVIVAPIAAMVVQMAISRTREYAADRLGGEIVGHPDWLASALSRLEQAAHAVPNDVAERNPATAHLFIVNPLSGARMDNLFATHPATENRIAALMELSREMGHSGGVSNRRSAPTQPAPRGPWGGGGTRRSGPWG